jgi:hypothetical protein
LQLKQQSFRIIYKTQKVLRGEGLGTAIAAFSKVVEELVNVLFTTTDI